MAGERTENLATGVRSQLAPASRPSAQWLGRLAAVGSQPMTKRAAILLGASLLGIAGCGSSHPTGYFNMKSLDGGIYNREVEQGNAEKETGHFRGFIDQSKQGPGYHDGVHCISTGHQTAVCEYTLVSFPINPDRSPGEPAFIRTETPKTLRVTIAPDGKSFVVGGS
jgi:hypothetical protein